MTALGSGAFDLLSQDLFDRDRHAVLGGVVVEVLRDHADIVCGGPMRERVQDPCLEEPMEVCLFVGDPLDIEVLKEEQKAR